MFYPGNVRNTATTAIPEKQSSRMLEAIVDRNASASNGETRESTEALLRVRIFSL